MIRFIRYHLNKKQQNFIKDKEDKGLNYCFLRKLKKGINYEQQIEKREENVH